MPRDVVELKFGHNVICFVAKITSLFSVALSSPAINCRGEAVNFIQRKLNFGLYTACYLKKKKQVT